MFDEIMCQQVRISLNYLILKTNNMNNEGSCSSKTQRSDFIQRSIKLSGPHPSPLVADCFVLDPATAISLTHKHTHSRRHTVTKQWQTVGHMLALPACHTVHVFKFLSRVWAGCQRSSAGRSLAATPIPQPGPRWLKPDAARKLTDSTNARQALIKQGNSAPGEVAWLRNKPSLLSLQAPRQKCLKNSTTDMGDMWHYRLPPNPKMTWC